MKKKSKANKPVKKSIRKTVPKNGNRKKTTREIAPKRRESTIKKIASKKTTGKKGTPKKALVKETYRLLKEYANRPSKGNKGTRKKPQKRALSKSNKSTNQKLKEQIKLLKKQLKTQADTFGYKPPVFKSEDDITEAELFENIRLFSLYSGIPEGAIRDYGNTEIIVADVIPPIFDTSDRSILKIAFASSLSYDEKIQQVSHLDQKTLNIYRLRDRLYPRAFMPMLEITYRGQNIVRANRMSPPGMNTTISEIVTYCQEFMEDFKTSYLEYIKLHPPGDMNEFDIEMDEESQNENSSWIFDPTNVTALFIRFLYAPTE